MSEDFLHYVWQFLQFSTTKLRTVDGQLLTLLQQGSHNTNAGPDFLDARIKIGKTQWAGNVELHVNASSWNAHKHQKDPAYDNTILHVVLYHDKAVKTSKGAVVPTFELSGRIDLRQYVKYEQFMSSRQWVPCENQIKEVRRIFVSSWLDRLLVERLERKTAEIKQIFEQTNKDWEETFYRTLVRGFGFKVNAQAFEQLAAVVPFKVWSRHRDSRLQLEALFLGQAGLLAEGMTDAHAKKLRKEYQHLQRKFNLKPLKSTQFRFMRMRPSNFPTIRISQLCSLLFQGSSFFSKVIEGETLNDFSSLLKGEASPYWQEHFMFDKQVSTRKRRLGKGSIDILLMNTIAPFLFFYGKERNEEKYCEQAIHLLDSISGELNTIIQRWKTLHLPTRTAAETQALLELKNEYCQKKKCLNCSIGIQLLKV